MEKCLINQSIHLFKCKIPIERGLNAQYNKKGKAYTNNINDNIKNEFLGQMH